MSTVNPHYTFQYVQPEAYRYSHDSVFFARWVYEQVKSSKIKCNAILDLCAGCGIIGMDLLFHLDRNPTTASLVTEIDFLEIQSNYSSYFEENKQALLSRLKHPAALSFLNINYNQLSKDHKKYDLIVANPPYFRQGHGTLSHSEFKNRCRFFIDADLKTLVSAISFSLDSRGKAYVLLKSLHEHGINICDEIKEFDFNIKIENVGLIRGVDIYEITANY
ncbi:MAG: methyltransferase [Bdellovibrionaceae bacterium]|nr:methyltransferase [Bdellovibrio sp.]